jgi:hypothetical protein
MPAAWTTVVARVRCVSSGGVTDEITAFADAMVFDGVSAELREGCIRVAAGTASGWRSKGHGWCCNRSRRQPADYWEADGI